MGQQQVAEQHTTHTAGPRPSLRLVSDAIRRVDRGERVTFEVLQSVRAAIRVDHAVMADLLAELQRAVEMIDEANRKGASQIVPASMRAAIASAQGAAS